MSKMVSLFGETTPKSKEKKRFRRPNWIAVVIIIAILIPVSLLIDSKIDLQNQKEEFLTEQGQWEKTKNNLTETNNKLSGQNFALKNDNKKLDLLAKKRLQEKNRALTEAERERTYGKDMENLALSHAAKFQEIRIQNETLSGQLGKRTVKADSYSRQSKMLENQMKIYKDIIEKQKKEILRLSEAYKKFLENKEKK